MTAVEHYPTASGQCACGETFANTWAQRAHMRTHAARDLASSTDLFPSDVDTPTSLVTPTAVSFALDSMGRHRVYPPTSRYLRDLGKVVGELADSMDERAAKAQPDGAA